MAVVLVGLYCGGYVAARREHWIVHRQGFSGGDRVGSHYVESADLETTPALSVVYWLTALAYTPLRYIELGGWHLVRPLGSPWPDHPAPNPTSSAGGSGAPSLPVLTPQLDAEQCAEREEEWARRLTLTSMAMDLDSRLRACTYAQSSLPECLDSEPLWYATLRCAELGWGSFPIKVGSDWVSNLQDTARIAGARKPHSARVQTVVARVTNDEAAARAALASVSTYAPATLALASVLTANGRAEEALRLFDSTAVRALPGANTQRAKALLATGKHAEAIASARKDLGALWPDPIEPLGSGLELRRDAHETLGNALHAAGRFAEAKAHLKRAASLGSKTARSRLDAMGE